jgi:hypothetical protein
MPYRLINKLQKLMTMEFESIPDTDLGSNAANLPAEVYDVVDEIADVARELFGPALRPNPRQDFLMQDACFPVKAGNMQLMCWRSGRIHTPRGIVTYF